MPAMQMDLICYGQKVRGRPPTQTPSFFVAAWIMKKAEESRKGVWRRRRQMETIDLEVSSSPWKAKKPPWRRRLLAIVEPRRRCPSPSSSSADSWMQMLSPSLPSRGPFLQPKKKFSPPPLFRRCNSQKPLAAVAAASFKKGGRPSIMGYPERVRGRSFVRSVGAGACHNIPPPYLHRRSLQHLSLPPRGERGERGEGVPTIAVTGGDVLSPFPRPPYTDRERETGGAKKEKGRGCGMGFYKL